MLMLLYWLAAALVLGTLRRSRALRGGVLVVGLAGIYGVTTVTWTVQVHTFVTCAVLAIQLLAACGAMRMASGTRTSRARLEGFLWLWAYLAVTQISLVQSEGAWIVAQLAGLCLVGVAVAWAIERGRPGVAHVAVAVAWTMQAAWSALEQPVVLYIPMRTGAWLDVVEVALPALVPGPLAALAIAALVLRVVRRGRAGGSAAKAFGLGRWATTGTCVLLAAPAVAFLVSWQGRPGAGMLSLEPGSVLPCRDLAALVPRETRRGHVIHAPSLAGMEASRIALERPRWLYFSNSPEVITEPGPERSRIVLARNEVPGGSGRLLISHWLPSSQMQSLVVEAFNPGPQPARLVMRSFEVMGASGTMGGLLESGVTLWDHFVRADTFRAHEIAPGRSWRQRYRTERGSLMAMGNMECSAPLIVTTALSRTPTVEEDGGPWGDAVEAMRGAQTRGVFTCPDERVEARIDVGDGRPRRLTLGVEALPGQDASAGPPRAARLLGRYGGITHVHLSMAPAQVAGFRRLLVVLMPSGGWVGALYRGHPRAVGSWRGLVLLNQPLAAAVDFDYDFTLPANSSAPVHLLAIPLR